MNRRIEINEMNTGYLLKVVGDNMKTETHAVETFDAVLRTIRNILDVKRVEQKEPALNTAQESPRSSEDSTTASREWLILPKKYPKIKYDKTLRKRIQGSTGYWYVDLPNGEIEIGYGGTSYRTTRERVLSIPYPIPYGYFKGRHMSGTAITCFRAYRNHLELENSQAAAEQEKSHKNEHTCSEDTSIRCIKKDTGDCDFCVSGSRFEEKKALSNKTKELREMVIRMGVQ